MTRNQVHFNLELQPRDRALLLLLLEQRYVTRDQLIDLGLFASVGRCNARLLQLLRAELIRRVRSPLGLEARAAIYALTGKGRSLLLSLFEPDSRDRLSASPARDTVALLSHSLHITTVRIAFLREALSGAFRIDWWLSELLAKHSFTEPGTRGQHVIKPDAAVRLAESTGHIRQFHIEVDCGNVSLPRMAARFRSYQWYAQTAAYEEVYGQVQLELLIVTSGRQRLERLKALSSEARSLPTHLSLLSDLKVGITAPIWTNTHSDRPYPLIEAREKRGVS